MWRNPSRERWRSPSPGRNTRDLPRRVPSRRKGARAILKDGSPRATTELRLKRVLPTSKRPSGRTGRLPRLTSVWQMPTIASAWVLSAFPHVKCVQKRSVRADDAMALWYLGFVLTAKGQPEEAIPVLERAVSISDRSPGVIGVLVRAYAHAGRRPDALRLLAELKRRRQAGYIPAAAFVNGYLGLGENDEAFAWLERAYQEQSNILQFLKVHPYFDPLRDDSRFKDLLRHVGLEQSR